MTSRIQRDCQASQRRLYLEGGSRMDGRVSLGKAVAVKLDPPGFSQTAGVVVGGWNQELGTFWSRFAAAWIPRVVATVVEGVVGAAVVVVVVLDVVVVVVGGSNWQKG